MGNENSTGPRRVRIEEQELEKLKTVAVPGLWARIEEKSRNRGAVHERTEPTDDNPSTARRVVIAAAVLTLFAVGTIPAWNVWSHHRFTQGATSDFGQYVRLPAQLNVTAGVATLEAKTNLPDGARVSITSLPEDGSLGGEVYCCVQVKNGTLTLNVVNPDCFLETQPNATVFLIVVALEVRPRGCDAGNCSPVGQPASVTEEFGSDLSGLSGEQVGVDENGQKHLFAKADYVWPANACAGSGTSPTAASFAPRACQDNAQLQAPDVETAVSALTTSLGQGRFCDIWAHFGTDKLRSAEDWNTFRSDWLAWLGALSTRGLSLRGDQPGEVNSIGFGVSSDVLDHYDISLTTGGSTQLATARLVSLGDGSWGLEELSPCSIAESGGC
jgi:hypothetical protein